MPSRIQVRRDIAANWTSANPVLASGEIGYETDAKKCKFGDGVSVWAELPYAVEASFTLEEKARLASIEPGAQPNAVASVYGRTGLVTAQTGDYTADEITETATRKVMTADERSKLAAMEPGAQVNIVTAVHGRTGAVIAQTGDYTADQIAETATRKVMTADERTKLTTVQMNAQSNPIRVSSAEKTAGTSATVRGFAPVDVKDVVAVHAPVTSVAGKTGAVSLQKGDIGLGSVSNDAQVRADLTYATKVAPAAGDKLLIKDQSDGQPKLADWASLPTGPAPATAAEKAAGVLAELRSFSPLDIREMVAVHAPVTSFNGRTGILSPQNNDYTADQITETTTRKMMTAEERAKLAAIDAGASAEQELAEIAAPYSELTAKLAKTLTGVKAVVLNPAHKQCVVKNGGSEPVVVVAPEGVTATGTVLNGSNCVDFSRSVHGLPGSFQKFVCSFHASVDQPRTDGTDHAQMIVSSFVALGATFELALLGVHPAPKVFQVFGRTAAGTVVVDHRSVDLPPSFTFGVLHHFLIACDLTVPVVQLAIDGQVIAWRPIGYTPILRQNEQIEMTTANLRIGGRSTTSSVNHLGHVEQFFLAFDRYLDISVPNNVQKFWNGGAVNLGYNGWRPFGTPPALFLNGSDVDFRINKARATNDPGTITGTLGAPTLLPTGTSPAQTIEGLGPTYLLAAQTKQQFVKIAGSSRYEVL